MLLWSLLKPPLLLQLQPLQLQLGLMLTLLFLLAHSIEHSASSRGPEGANKQHAIWSAPKPGQRRPMDSTFARGPCWPWRHTPSALSALANTNTQWPCASPTRRRRRRLDQHPPARLLAPDVKPGIFKSGPSSRLASLPAHSTSGQTETKGRERCARLRRAALRLQPPEKLGTWPLALAAAAADMISRHLGWLQCDSLVRPPVKLARQFRTICFPLGGIRSLCRSDELKAIRRLDLPRRSTRAPVASAALSPSLSRPASSSSPPPHCALNSGLVQLDAPLEQVALVWPARCLHAWGALNCTAELRCGPAAKRWRLR